MKLLLVILSLITLSACDGFKGDTGPQGPPGPAVSAPAAPDAVLAEVAIINAQRSAQGQESLVPGLDCTLYTVPTSTTQIVGATLTSVGSFDYLGSFNVANSSVTTGFSVLPSQLQPYYQTWFVTKCTGVLIMGSSGWHSFSLSSDDGSNLSISGAFLNNDGLHSIKTVSGAKFLAQGEFSFELDFFQATGSQALILDMDGSVLSAENFYH